MTPAITTHFAHAQTAARENVPSLQVAETHTPDETNLARIERQGIGVAIVLGLAAVASLVWISHDEQPKLNTAISAKHVQTSPTGSTVHPAMR